MQLQHRLCCEVAQQSLDGTTWQQESNTIGAGREGGPETEYLPLIGSQLNHSANNLIKDFGRQSC